MTTNDTQDLVELLRAGMFEEFRSRFKDSINGSHDGIFKLAEAINVRLQELSPGCESKIVVSQKTNSDKHIIMIMDASRIFGESFTVTRQMFVI
ncbi:MAG: hypothetical protein KC777_25340 [Cyanobacteria bacterium HKST-UBA02]|nr:hypothetical protein [Cyanobacteria bacterium HKST-UBA02]